MADFVLVHGLWNRGWSMAVMAKRLRSRGHSVMVFSYPTRSNSLDGHAEDLHGFITQSGLQSLHLVGHSMGGLVILNMMHNFDDLPPGRVVLMGTPVKGSGVVRRLGRLPGQNVLFGKAGVDLRVGFDSAPDQHETGMIRGTRGVGLGRIVGGHNEPNDGSIAISETQLEGLKDSIELPVAHTEMLISALVLEQAEHFVMHGSFNHS